MFGGITVWFWAGACLCALLSFWMALSAARARKEARVTLFAYIREIERERARRFKGWSLTMLAGALLFGALAAVYSWDILPSRLATQTGELAARTTGQISHTLQTSSPTFTPLPTEVPTLTPSPTLSPSPTSTSTSTPTSEPMATTTSTPLPTLTSTATATPTVTQEPSFFATAEGGHLISLVLAQGVTADGEPISPTVDFPAETERVYAIFTFDRMQEGLTWRHVWSWDDGEEEVILWDETVPWHRERPFGITWRYIFPGTGRYKLQVYVDGRLERTAIFSVGVD